jgi:hypothetical protein
MHAAEATNGGVPAWRARNRRVRARNAGVEGCTHGCAISVHWASLRHRPSAERRMICYRLALERRD